MARPDEMMVAPGTLLAAGPDLLDPNFMHAVVLICSHSAEGAIGFIVNRPAEYTTQEAFPDHPLLGQVDLPVYQGGPVQLDALQYLHRLGTEIPGSLPIVGDVCWGGDADALAEWLRDHEDQARERVRLLIGYSGWGAGQLESELAEGVWLPAPGSAERVFSEAGETLWRTVVRSLGEAAEGLSEQPPDPSWN